MAGLQAPPLRITIIAPGQQADGEPGNDRFLRGVARELVARGHAASVSPMRSGPHSARVLEPLSSRALEPSSPPGLESAIERALDGADVVLVHDLAGPATARQVRRHHIVNGGYLLLLYDTGRHALTAPSQSRRLNLTGFDGVLTVSDAIRQTYLDRGWASRVWTWREAADTAIYARHPGVARTADLALIGNWEEIGHVQEFARQVVTPARRLRLSGVVHGERYPWRARRAIHRGGLRYAGSIAEHLVPAVFARHRFTITLSPPGDSLLGVPPTRLFEALACGIPLICSGWDDPERMFAAGRDFLPAGGAREVESAMRALQRDRALAAEIARQGRATVLARHTCAHRVDELLSIIAGLRAGSSARTRLAAGSSARTGVPAGSSARTGLHAGPAIRASPIAGSQVGRNYGLLRKLGESSAASDDRRSVKRVGVR